MAEIALFSVHSVMSIIARQVLDVIFYDDKLNRLADRVRELEDRRDYIQHLVEAERRNAREITHQVQHWLARVDDVCVEASLLQEYTSGASVGCFGLPFPNLMLRLQLSRQATTMAEVIVELLENEHFRDIGYAVPPASGSFPATSSGFIMPESWKSTVDDICKALMDKKVSKIGLYGLGGVGKTNLVKVVAQRARDDFSFDTAVMTTVSKTPDLKRIQGEIADWLGLQFDEETIWGRARRLSRRIRQEKRILIILDDIWTKFDLEMVGIPFGDDCKVLMTSRNKNVLLQMEVKPDFKLDILSQEDTWKLFEAIAGDAVENPRLRSKATKAAEKCAGFPLLIAMAAKAAKNEDVYASEDFLDQVDRLIDETMHEIISSILEYLDGDEIKAIFLLCGVIGQDVAVDDLLKYGMGLELFKDIDTVYDKRNRLHKMIRDLKASCLLLEDDIGVQVNMLSIVHDVAISIARMDQNVLTIKEGIESKEWPREDFLRSCTQMILDGYYIWKLSERFDYSNLKLLCLKNNVNKPSLTIPDSLFEGMGSLQVLDLKRMKMSSLPRSLASLNKLYTLCLDECSLEDVDGIGVLKNLEILSLVKSSITKLSSKIGELDKLRILDLEGSTIETIPPNIISELTKLEELNTGNMTIKWKVENSSDQNKNASLAELSQLHNLAALDIRIPESQMLPGDFMFNKRLKRYKIVVGDVWERTHNIKYGSSRTLMLKLHATIPSGDGIKVLIKGAEDLHLDEIEGISNILYQLDEEGFPLLKYLLIQNNTKIQHIINSEEWTRQAHYSFPSLEKIELHNLSHLEKIYHGPRHVRCFGQLKRIKVKKCNQLQNLFVVSMVEGLSKLLEIEVEECHSLKEIVAVEETENGYPAIGEEVVFPCLRSLTLQHLPELLHFYGDERTYSRGQKKPFFSSKVPFPTLETLKLRSLDLDMLWEEEEYYWPNSVTYLTTFIVEDCRRIKYLFLSSMVERLSNLKQLEISQCHDLEEIIKTPEERENYYYEAMFFKLETLKLSSLNLKKIWGKFQLSTAPLQYLTSLIFESCGDLKYLFSASMIVSFSRLKRLEISKCNMMEEIMKDDNHNWQVLLFPNLETIIISDMQNLKIIWQCHQEPKPDSLGRLQRMEVKNCPKLEMIISVEYP